MINLNQAGGRRSLKPSPCKSCGECKPDENVICDECKKEFHIKCLKPPLPNVPDSRWLCSKCSTFKINEILNKSGRPCNSSEELETSARLSVFDKFLFLVDDGSMTGMMHANNSRDSIIENEGQPKQTNNNNRKRDASNFHTTSASHLLRSGMPGDEEEKAEISKRLSVFDDFLFLIPDGFEQAHQVFQNNSGPKHGDDVPRLIERPTKQIRAEMEEICKNDHGKT